MEQQHAFPVRGGLWVLVHCIGRFTEVFCGTTVQTAPDVEATGLATVFDQLLGAQDQGANQNVR